uniref:Citrate transporter-like domain-containing protein n=1 Tax=Tetranychus urticae TaxID=32264 RepID=T1KQH5_TETUR
MPLYQKCSCEETDNPKNRTLKSGLPKTWNNQQTNDNQDGDSSVLQSSSNPTSESKIAQLRKIMYISISSSANVGTTTTLTSGGPNLVLAYVLDENKKQENDICFDYPECSERRVGDFVTMKLNGNQFLMLTLDHPYNDLKTVMKFDIICQQSSSKERQQKVTLTKKTEGDQENVIQWWYHERTSVDYLNWLMFAAPGSLLTILLNWIIFKYLYLRKHKVSKTNSKANNVLQEKYKQLGTLRYFHSFLHSIYHNTSGLSAYLGNMFTKINGLPVVMLIIIFAIIAGFLTEFASNSTTATIVLPVAASIGINPLVFLIPVTMACSMCFILPAGTPANALVYEHAGLKPSDMLKQLSLLMKVTSLAVIVANLNLLGYPIFGLSTTPDWARATFNSTLIS